jgi:diaminohydroxyphosphoribosylaminopyrimidine deaminase/5-amino-6-(5-phosphoribosylamino)uracil reductase
VRAKLAMSLDGRTAMASGESQWITGPAARQDVQRLRAMSCAIVTGVGTVLADDCALTVRADELGLTREEARLAGHRQPLRVVLDSSLQTPEKARVLDGAAPTLLCHDEQAAIPPGIVASAVSRLALPRGDQGLDLRQMLDHLTARQCNEILVESGPRLAGALLQAGLLDELIVYMAPALLGDRARPLLELPLDTMSDKVQLQLEDVRKVGQDWRFTAIPVFPGAEP